MSNFSIVSNFYRAQYNRVCSQDYSITQIRTIGDRTLKARIEATALRQRIQSELLTSLSMKEDARRVRYPAA